MHQIQMRTSRAPHSVRTSLVAVAVLALATLAAPPSYAGGAMGGEGGGGWGGPQYGGGGREPRYRGRSGFSGVGRWQNCHRFTAASRAAFRNGDYARGNALQDQFYNCMRSRWID